MLGAARLHGVASNTKHLCKKLNKIVFSTNSENCNSAYFYDTKIGRFMGPISENMNL